MHRRMLPSLAIAFCFALLLSAAATAADEPARVAGKWEMSWEGRQGPQKATLNFEQDGEKLKGTFTSQGGRETPLSGNVSGKSVTFSIKRETPRGQFTVEYKGTADGESMKGTAQMGQFTIEWTARRQKEEKEKEK